MKLHLLGAKEYLKNQIFLPDTYEISYCNVYMFYITIAATLQRVTAHIWWQTQVAGHSPQINAVTLDMIL